MGDPIFVSREVRDYSKALRKAKIYGRTNSNSNFIFIYGCEPSDGVQIQAKMIEIIAKIMSEKFNTETLTLTLPDAFN